MPCRHEDVIQHMVLSDLETEADVWPWMGRIFELGDPSTRILAAAVIMPSVEYLERGASGTEWLEPSEVENLTVRARGGLDEWARRINPGERPELIITLGRLSELTLFWVEEFGGTADECACVIGSLSAAFRALDEGSILHDTLHGDIRELALVTSDAVRLALRVHDELAPKLAGLIRRILDTAASVGGVECPVCYLS